MKYLVLDKDRWNNALEEADHILKYTEIHNYSRHFST